MNNRIKKESRGGNAYARQKRNVKTVSAVKTVREGVPDVDVGADKVKRLTLGAPDETNEISIWYARKRNNMRRLFLRLVAFTLLPTLLAALYFGLIVTDRYVSTFQVTVSAQDSGVMSMFSSILGGGSSGSGQENYIIEEFIQSQAALQQLDQQLDLRGHFSQDYIDYFSRLNADATNEEFLAYFLSMVNINNDTTSQIITVQVQAFSPEMAKTLADLLIMLCEDLANNLNKQSRADTLSFAQNELGRAEERFRKVGMEIANFRNREGELNPVQSAAAITAIITNLEAQIVETRVQIARYSTFMRADSVRISSLKDKVNALTKQVEIESKRLVNPKGNAPGNTKGDVIDRPQYTELLSEYESLLIEENLAQANYTAANQAYQIARSEVAKQQYVYLIAFSPPILPDESVEPQRLYSVLVVFITALILYMLGSFTWAAVREHVGA